MAPASRFCTSCGQYLGWDQQQGWDRQQLVKEHKATSGWAKFGNFLFAVGVLCVVIGPIVLLVMPATEHTSTSLIQVIAAGVVCIFIGLPLMSKR
jgi:nitrate reductase gamma subunit